MHRIGRTARSTNKGTAYTFFTPGNSRQARDLVRVLEEARQAINPKLRQLADSCRGGGGGGEIYSTVDGGNTDDGDWGRTPFSFVGYRWQDALPWEQLQQP